MAFITYKTFLMHEESSGSTSTYKKFCDIKDYPDLIASRDTVETTTLSDKAKTYAPGLINTPEGYPFTINYDLAVLQAADKLAGKDEKWSVWFGGTEGADGTLTPTGENGKFDFTGVITYQVGGKGTNDVTEATLNIIPSKAIEKITITA